MANYRFSLRDTSGNYVSHIPADAWVYFEYTRKKNQVGNCQGILSIRRYPELQNFFAVGPGQNLDFVLEVWRQPNLIRGLPILPYRRDAQYLLRYERKEHLNDGRPRRTTLCRTPEHLLGRARIYPRISTPPPITSEADGVALWPWALPIEDTFTGGPTGTTTERMKELFERAKSVTPSALLAVTAPVPTAGGIPDHPISERYTTLLEALQSASAASWYAWYVNTGGTGPLTPGPAGDPYPVDFSLNWTGSGWLFETFIGGLGDDRRVGFSGNPLVLSPSKDNVSQPVWLTDRLEEETRTLIAGELSGQNRDIILFHDPNAELDSPWNTSEGYWDSRQLSGLGARFRLNRCDQMGLPATQLRFRIKNDAFPILLLATAVVVVFNNDQRLGGIVVSYTTNPIPDADEVVIDFAPTIVDCDYGNGASIIEVPDATTSSGMGEAIRQGEDRLKLRGKRRDVTMIITQRKGAQYGRDFDLGTVLTTSFEGEDLDRQVTKVRVVLSATSGESVTTELSSLEGDESTITEPLRLVIDEIIDNERRIKNIST